MAIKIERKKDDEFFNAISERDLKKKISQHVAETFKSNSDDTRNCNELPKSSHRAPIELPESSQRAPRELFH
jgi:hypothetical protein